MPNELKAPNLTASLTYKATVQNAAGLYWTGTGNTFAASGSITWSAAGIAMTADPVIATKYVGSFPAAITTPGRYTVEVWEIAGGSLASSDLTVSAASGEIDWDGAAESTPDGVIFDGDAAAGSTTTAVRIGEAYNAANLDRYVGAMLVWTGADADGQSRITDYADAGSGASTVTVTPALSDAPSAGDDLQIVRLAIVATINPAVTRNITIEQS